MKTPLEQLAPDERDTLLDLAKLAKLTPDELQSAVDIDDGFVRGLRAPLYKLKTFPPLDALTRLKELSITDGFAKTKKHKLTSLDIASASIQKLSLKIGTLQKLSLKCPSLTSLELHCDELLDFTGGLGTLKSLNVFAPGFPFTGFAVNETQLTHLRIAVQPDKVRKQGSPALELPTSLSSFANLQYLLIDARGTSQPLSIDSTHHEALTRLVLYTDGPLTIKGKLDGVALSLAGDADPRTLHAVADAHNFDDDLHNIYWVVNHKNCSRDTARLIYWRLNPTWYLQFESDEADDINKDELALVRHIESLFRDGRDFDPTPFQVDEDKDPYPELPKLRAIPAFMFD